MNDTHATVLLTNGATPYRTPVFNAVAQQLDAFTVVYDELIQKGRDWSPGEIQHAHVVWDSAGRATVWRALTSGRVCLIVSHLNPRSLALASLVAVTRGRVIYFTDGGVISEKGIGLLRKAVRWAVAHRFDRYIAGTPDTRRHFTETFGVEPARVFSSYLCPLEAFRPSGASRRYDVVLGGRDIWEKNHAFSIDVCAAMAADRRIEVAVFGELGRVTALDPIARHPNVRLTHFGTLAPLALASLLSQSRLFMMTSIQEPWGLVLHEALRCGCTALAAPTVTSAQYLADIYPTLRILPLEHDGWCRAANEMLSSKAAQATQVADPYTIESAAAGIVAAVKS